MKHIYCISGFGADERVFSKLDFKDHEVHFIQWLNPLNNETIAEYAMRMREEIQHEDPVLIGLSFGGMMSIEISKIINTSKVILISSVKSLHELPLWMRLTGKLKLNKVFPLKSYKLFEPIQNYNLGIENKDELRLVREYRVHIGQAYTNWSINQILNWKNEWQPANLIHIHGSKDHMFPIKNIKADFVITNGGHFMIMNMSDKVNTILEKIYKELFVIESQIKI